MAVNKVVVGSNTLVDLTEDTVTSDTLLTGSTAHNASGELITGSYQPPKEMVLTSISVTTPPSKTTYYIGETFDGTGMVVTGFFNDGELMGQVTGYTVSPSGPLTLGTSSVTITYSEGAVVKTTQQAISVVKLNGTMTGIPSSVTLNSSTLTRNFTIGGNFDGSYTVISDDTSVATVSLVSGKTYRISHVNQKTGTANITITPNNGVNYTNPAAQTISVTAQFATIWGVEWDWDNGSSTRGTRTDAAAGFSDPSPAISNGSGSSPFDSLMPWAGMVKETRTGGIMVKEPKYWFKWTKTGKKIKLQIADGPVDGFFVDPVNMDKGDGLGELDFSYIARYHCGTSDCKSTTGVAQKVSFTPSEARTAIHNLGTNIWPIDFAQMWYVGMLYLVEFADWDSQTTIGYGCSASGSKVNNGMTDAMQYHTGTTAASRTTYGYTQYRNIEGWWDNVCDWLDGCEYDVGDGVLSVALNPNDFSNSSNYTAIGQMPSSHPTSYPSDLAMCTISGFEWAVYPAANNGSSSSYVPDEWSWVTLSDTLAHGGDSHKTMANGMFNVEPMSIMKDDLGSSTGCRLQERPPKTS